MRRPILRLLPIATLLSLSTLLAAAPQSGRALTIEDYYRVKSVGGATISPDGGWVVFTISQRIEDDAAQNRENQSLTKTYVVATSGAEPRHVQHDGREVSGARWTDDSWLEYAVGGETYKVPPSGGAPQKVEGVRGARGTAGGGRGGRGGGASTIPSRDGAWVVELRENARPKPASPAPTDFEKRHHDRFKGVTFDWKDFQRDGAAFPAPDPTAGNPMQIVVRPSTSLGAGPAGGGAAKTLVDLDIRPANIAWHPDGKTIAFTADPKWRDPLRYSKSDLWTVTLDGQVKQLTNDGFNYSDIEYSPDGKYLSYARTFGTDYVIQQKLNHGGPRDLYLWPTAGGEHINLTESWDLEPGDSRWSPDGKFIYFSAAIGGENHLFRVAVDGRRAVEQLTKGPRRVGAISYDKAMTKIAYTVAGHETPGDVYVANIDGTNERRLSNMHKDDVAEIALSKAERLEWESKDGTKIEGWLMYPHAYQRGKGPYPLIVVSHGGPHAATGYSFDFKKQYFAANGYFVLDTNFRSSTGYGEKFKWATWGAWGDKDGEDVVSGIDHVIARYPVDRNRVGHIGHSYGGFMSNWLITQYPDRFAAAISGAGISNWISDYGTADIYRTKETEFFGTPWDEAARNRMIRQSPLTYAGRVKTPTLFVHGEVDQRVPYEEAEQMYFALRRRGVPAKMIQYAGQSHGISGHNNVVHRMLNELAWFDKYLRSK